MRKIIACEFVTLDGVIRNEENDGDGFKPKIKQDD